MSFLTTRPEALSLAAGDLQTIAAALNAQNAAAAGPITGLAPAAADEVSALQATQFSAYGTLYQQISAQAAAMQEMFIHTLRVSADSYGETETANSAAAAPAAAGLGTATGLGTPVPVPPSTRRSGWAPWPATEPSWPPCRPPTSARPPPHSPAWAPVSSPIRPVSSTTSRASATPRSWRRAHLPPGPPGGCGRRSGRPGEQAARTVWLGRRTRTGDPGAPVGRHRPSRDRGTRRHHGPGRGTSGRVVGSRRPRVRSAAVRRQTRRNAA